MKKDKKVCKFTLMPETVEGLERHCGKTAYTKSAFVDVAIQEKLERECKTK